MSWIDKYITEKIYLGFPTVGSVMGNCGVTANGYVLSSGGWWKFSKIDGEQLWKANKTNDLCS